MARITYKKISCALFLSLLGLSSNSYAMDATAFIKDLFTVAGGKAVDANEGKDLSKFMNARNCRGHYTWGEPYIKNPLIVSRMLFICKGNFALHYDPKNKMPISTSEIVALNGFHYINNNTPLNAKFMLDSTVPSRMQVSPEDYLNSIYTPVQLASVYNVRTQDLQSEPPQFIQHHFDFTNTVPMVRDNLANTIWQELENQVRVYSLKKDSVYITTGVIYLNGQNNGKLKKSEAVIPTHFYKIITDSFSLGTVSYIIPNKEIYTTKTKKLNDPKNAVMCNGGPCTLSNFIVPIQEVERLTQTEFYPDLAPETTVKVKLDPNEINKLERQKKERELEGQL